VIIFIVINSIKEENIGLSLLNCLIVFD